MARFTDEDRLRWTYEGQWVWAPLRRTREDMEKGMAFRGRVQKACGYTAYVESRCGAHSGWYDVLDLFPADPPKSDPPRGGEPIPVARAA